jgi:hypothetical protein
VPVARKVGLGDVVAADRLYYHDTRIQGVGCGAECVTSSVERKTIRRFSNKAQPPLAAGLVDHEVLLLLIG